MRWGSADGEHSISSLMSSAMLQSATLCDHDDLIFICGCGGLVAPGDGPARCEHSLGQIEGQPHRRRKLLVPRPVVCRAPRSVAHEEGAPQVGGHPCAVVPHKQAPHGGAAPLAILVVLGRHERGDGDAQLPCYAGGGGGRGSAQMAIDLTAKQRCPRAHLSKRVVEVPLHRGRPRALQRGLDAFLVAAHEQGHTQQRKLTPVSRWESIAALHTLFL